MNGDECMLVEREGGGGGGEGGGDVRVIDIDDRGYFFFNWEG